MIGKRNSFESPSDRRGRRWHHDQEQGSPERSRNHGHGGHHGHRGHGRHGMQSSRKLSSADLQLILLAQLANCSSHGYELIKSLDDHSHGLYVPSPGMIYPALTYLEELGYAAVEMKGTKKRYSLTEAGRNHYEQNREDATRILSEMERIGAQMAQAQQAMENGQVQKSSNEVGSESLDSARQELRRALHKNEPYTTEEVKRVAEILSIAATEIRNLLGASSKTGGNSQKVSEPVILEQQA